MKKIIILSMIWLQTVSAGCIVQNIINYTTTCTINMLDCVVPPKKHARDAPLIKECDETVGEYIIFTVRELDDDALICKQYKIMVDEYSKNIGNIRLVRSGSCDKPSEVNFDVFMEEFKDMPLTRCIINIQVYDSDEVHLQIKDESEKAVKSATTDQSTSSTPAAPTPPKKESV